MAHKLPKYDSYKQAFRDVSLPAAWVDLDFLDQNIRDILARAKSTPIRLASKSIRCRYILDYILKSNEQFRGIMCYHPREAAFLASHGMDDLLIAYPSMCKDSLKAACHAAANGTTIYFMVDSAAHVQVIDQLAREAGIVAKLCLDLDMSVDFPGLYFGVYRSPIRDAQAAVDLYRSIKPFKNTELCAVMGYEAQIAGVGDNVPGKFLENQVIKQLKARSIPILAQRRAETVAALKNEGANIALVNGGGTGSIESTIAEEAVTEVTVGSGFYSPHLFDYYSHFRHLPAAGFAIEVTRQARKHIYTGGSGGYIASGAVNDLKAPKPYLPAKIKTIKNEGFGEVQSPLIYKGKDLMVGDPVFLRHCKAGELCERFNELHLIRDKKIIDNVPTYRGEQQCFV